MKIHTEQRDIHRGGVRKESAFTIQTSAHAFDILSNALYQNKILAIVRELSCNAHDAHIAAGKSDVPVEIHLPTTFDPVFYVRDNGIGMSDFDIRGGYINDDGVKLSLEDGEGQEGFTRVPGVYNSYFTSTKQSSDDYIGQLGLGSKSPFCYAAAFNVDSRFNGIKRYYSCFKNEAGEPAVVLMGEQETTECNGMQVTIPVKAGDDIVKFTSNAKHALMYFNPAPIIHGNTNFTPYKVAHTLKGTNWMIRETEHHASMTGAYVIQGFVAYPLNQSILSEHKMSAAATLLMQINIDLTVPIGAVEVAPSREALSYTPRTVQNLLAALEQTAGEIRASFQAEFDACKTWYEAACMYHKFYTSSHDKFGGMFKSMHSDDPFLWNGSEVKSTTELDLRGIENMKLVFYTMERSGKRRSSVRRRLTNKGEWYPNKIAQFKVVAVNSKTTIIVAEQSKSHTAIVRRFLEQSPEGSHVILVVPIVKNAYSQAEVDKIAEGLGHAPWKKIDDLGVVLPRSTRVSSGSVTRRNKEARLVFSGFRRMASKWGRSDEVNRTFSRLTWDTQIVSLDEGGFYIPIKGFDPEQPKAYKIDIILQAALALGLLPANAKIVGMNEKERVAIKDNDKWLELFSYLEKQYTNANSNEALSTKPLVADFGPLFGEGLVRPFVGAWDEIKGEINDGPFKAFVQQLVDLKSLCADVDANEVTKFTVQMGIPCDAKKIGGELRITWDTILAGYPMLTLLPWTDTSTTGRGKIIAYINDVQKTLTI